LELAVEIQRSLLPHSDPAGFPVIGLNRPAHQVSGDFFDFFPLDEQRIPFALGDVSGKGMNAALLMAKAVGLFRCLAKSSDNPADLLAAINRETCETASRGMFVTMVTGIYDHETGALWFANAGHEPPLLRAPDRSYRSFPAEAPPLGILPDLTFETYEIELAGGEFYIFTDGLTEYRYGEQEALGVEGLIQLVESHADLALADRLNALLEELDHEGWEARDDLTVLAIDDAWISRND
jgi:sigma-B regulation protein RsbU (phosphoserine phosphatase)